MTEVYLDTKNSGSNYLQQTKKAENTYKNITSIFDKVNKWSDLHSKNYELRAQTLDFVNKNLNLIRKIQAQLEKSNVDQETKEKLLNKLLEEAKKIEKFNNDVQARYEKLQEKIGKKVDFMENKDPNNEQDYNNQTEKLAQGEIEQKDTSKDNLVDFNEYLEGELKGQELTQDEKEEIKQLAYQQFDAMDENQNGTLEKEEFQEFYINLDLADGKKDGIIDSDSIFE